MKRRAVLELVQANTYTEQPLLDNKDCFSEDKTKGSENTIKMLTVSLVRSIHDLWVSLKNIKLSSRKVAGKVYKSMVPAVRRK